MKIANIDREILHNFWKTWGISMKFSRKMCLMIILKFTKKQDFTLSLEDRFFEKPQRGAILGLINSNFFQYTSNIQKNIPKREEIYNWHVALCYLC